MGSIYIKGIPYQTVTNTAKRSGKSPSWIRRLAERGSIEGAIKAGASWIIPAVWECPKFPRYRAGRVSGAKNKSKKEETSTNESI